MPQFNITDKVIIIFVRTTVINRRCRTHKEIIVASLKKGKAKWSSFYIVYRVTDCRDNKKFITSTEASRHRGKAAGRSIMEDTAFINRNDAN